ncbi:acetylxylan esterase [Cellulomonas sp. McL0617]|uniref:acetylxylan esterase n=1 Tax=Cellulomonas sp. McL0617 TaxID=3415675 RepID=UPI003CF72FAB
MLPDMPRAELATYSGSTTEPPDFDAFWAQTLEMSRAAGSGVTLQRVETGLQTVELFDLTFPGYLGQPVRAWLRLPAQRSGPLPAVVQYVGYGGGRGHEIENLLWSSAGFAHLLMDTRGQGSGWSLGVTADPHDGHPQFPGVMTRGIEDPATYYYRRMFTDAVRAVDAVRTLDGVDPDRVAVVGGSQGGGTALAAAGLVPDLRAVVAYVPFLCDFPRAIRVADTQPYTEVVSYLAVHRDRADQVERTLAYFDGVHFARRGRADAFFSVAMMDPICPPSTVYAAYNSYRGPKQLTEWEFNGHEGGGPQAEQDAVRALRDLLG